MADDRLTTARMEAFSDGVIAVIITIMVLDLHVPAEHLSNLEGLHAVAPTLFIYLLSFVQVGIYWVNHHYLLDDAETVTHGMLWANLTFLFCLSLFPFAARWVGERGISSFSIALYAVVSVLPALAWNVLSAIICRRSGATSADSPAKLFISSALYLGAIPMAYVSPYAALAMLIAVAILWLIPPRKIVEMTQNTHTHSL
ncbi:DUF1211 domain-containing protein [Granulicella sp. 5B5]|uniref:TMEM175 family protein n=1 Tax=Granulicella sp. 5B5 TaxID=1617967 RepID=UPI0015F4443B|nr:TMEM175 family protein [Granulicella sp. 5B5]QMV17928.1 DUF1211 domain-containing protein [Granulicella sp. 5B5]